ncbi:hypothetical protein BJV77DRAFT_963992 [Russula vinacea]|nr:hypothetical protein BJV77DRAFT_963992 [Russula vinacea]
MTWGAGAIVGGQRARDDGDGEKWGGEGHGDKGKGGKGEDEGKNDDESARKTVMRGEGGDEGIESDKSLGLVCHHDRRMTRSEDPADALYSRQRVSTGRALLGRAWLSTIGKRPPAQMRLTVCPRTGPTGWSPGAESEGGHLRRRRYLPASTSFLPA